MHVIASNAIPLADGASPAPAATATAARLRKG
jgi:hypothetical protein